MDYIFRQANNSDQGALLSIFNHYVETSYAAYFEDRVDESFLIQLRQMTSGYPFYVIEAPEKQAVGFGLIHRYHPAKTFNRVAELSYFISPSHTRKGLGTKLLKLLIGKAAEMGIDTLLASISSLNQSSVNFHNKNGFVECGRFIRVGRKFGQDFNMVWMQKHLHKGAR
jgi:L-amino acid N-acyltransferase YncA